MAQGTILKLGQIYCIIYWKIGRIFEFEDRIIVAVNRIPDQCDLRWEKSGARSWSLPKSPGKSSLGLKQLANLSLSFSNSNLAI